jgi:hypothetical protein
LGRGILAPVQCEAFWMDGWTAPLPAPINFSRPRHLTARWWCRTSLSTSKLTVSARFVKTNTRRTRTSHADLNPKSGRSFRRCERRSSAAIRPPKLHVAASADGVYNIFLPSSLRVPASFDVASFPRQLSSRKRHSASDAICLSHRVPASPRPRVGRVVLSPLPVWQALERPRRHALESPSRPTSLGDRRLHLGSPGTRRALPL